MALVIDQFICRADNYGILLHDDEAGLTASIDAPEEGPIRNRLAANGWRLDRIFITHHHGDHTAGNLPLKREYGCTIVGPASEADKIPGLDERVKGGDVIAFGKHEIHVIDTPGHTLGHITYWIPSAGVAFAGDTLFAIGCGRLFEGTPEMMWTSLRRLAELPPETRVHCGHEYTATNARFALTIEPDNPDLIARADEVMRLTAAGRPTLPTTIALERATNPFLRADEPAIRGRLGMETADAEAVFAEIRTRKDRFS